MNNPMRMQKRDSCNQLRKVLESTRFGKRSLSFQQPQHIAFARKLKDSAEMSLQLSPHQRTQNVRMSLAIVALTHRAHNDKFIARTLIPSNGMPFVNDFNRNYKHVYKQSNGSIQPYVLLSRSKFCDS